MQTLCVEGFCLEPVAHPKGSMKEERKLHRELAEGSLENEHDASGAPREGTEGSRERERVEGLGAAGDGGGSAEKEEEEA